MLTRNIPQKSKIKIPGKSGLTGEIERTML
jgi:hypothetical protein